jgi:hypothetical protein
MQSKLLKDVYDKIETLVGNDFSNPLYRVREMAGYTFEDKFAPFKSQDEITDVVEKSNLPQEVKDEYNQAVISEDRLGYSKLTEKPSLKIEVNGKSVIEQDGARVYFKDRVNPFTEKATGEIELDLIESDVKGKGNARKVLDKFLEYTDSLNKPVFLTVSPRNKETTEKGLIKFYESVGFRLEPTGFEMIRKPKKITISEQNGNIIINPGNLVLTPYEEGYKMEQGSPRLYKEVTNYLLKSQTPLYVFNKNIEFFDSLVEEGIANKTNYGYLVSSRPSFLDKNNEASPSDVMQYANTTDEKLSKEETTEAIDLAVSLGVETSEEAVAILKDAFLENDSFVFDKKKMKKAGFNDYEITKILTDVNLQNQIKNNLAKLENTDFSAPLMDVQTSPEIGIFGKQKVKPKVKTVNVKTVNEQGEVVDKVSDTKELLRKTYPDTLPEDIPQIAVSLLKASENIVNNYNDLFYSTLEDLKDASLDLGVDLKDIENRVFPLENFKSFVNSLMNYYANPSDAFAEVYDEFFENYGVEKATKPTMSTPYTEYELFDKFNLVRNGDEYIKVEDVEIEPSAERQAKIPKLEVEDFAVDFDKLEKLVYHKEQLGAEMKTLQKPLVEEINLREVKKNPYLKATSEGVKLVSEDPLTAQKAELYGYEPKVEEKQPKKIETDYSLVQEVLVTQLTSENKVRTPKGNFTKFMDDNNKSVFLLDGSKQKTVDLEGYLSKADNMPKIEAKKLYSKEEYENNFGCLN